MITLTNGASGDVTRLWQGQGSTVKLSGEPDVQSLYGRDSDETFITSLKSQLEFQYSGVVSGIRLSKQSGYSGDPTTALASWVAEMETFVNGSQGGGHDLDDDGRNINTTVAVTNFSWERASEGGYEVSWDLSLAAGDIVMDEEGPRSFSVSPSTTATLAGTDLQDTGNLLVEKKQQVELTPIQFEDPIQTLVQPNGGATRRIIITGVVSGTESELRTFDNTMYDLVGDNQAYTYSSAFPGRDLNVIVKSYDSTRSAGVTRLSEYNLELFEGTVV